MFLNKTKPPPASQRRRRKEESEESICFQHEENSSCKNDNISRVQAFLSLFSCCAWCSA